MTLEKITRADVLECAHGFYTRRGGHSKGLYAGLNCGLGSNDDPELVLKNRSLVCVDFGMEAEALCGVHQIHSSKVVTIKQHNQPREKADAMVSAQNGLLLGILTADCQPVLFNDPINRVIGAAHAGWKGALSGVLEATVEAMIALGAERRLISAVIGPCISPKAYEVGPEFYENFISHQKEYATYFTRADQKDKYLFDLPAFGLKRLRDCGLKDAIWTGDCTYSDAERFYSYRRTTHKNEPDYGRLISVISL